MIRILTLALVLATLSACGVVNDPGMPESAASTTNGAITRAAKTYAVTATITGLSGPGLTLELNGGQPVPVLGNGPVTFAAALANGAAYAVTVQTQPSTPRVMCSISNGSGAVTGANVTNVAVNCAKMIGFMYQAQGFVAQTQVSDEIFSYGIAAGSGALLPLGNPIVSGSQPGSWPSMASGPDGKFLYVGDALSGTISIYAVDSDTGALTALDSVSTPGLEPTQMLMTASGFLFVASNLPAASGQSSATALSTFAVNSTTGALTPTGTPLTFDEDSWFVFAATPDGKWLYLMVADLLGTPALQTLTAYAIDPATGALTPGRMLSWTPTEPNDPNLPGQSIAIDPLGRYLYLASVQSTPMQPAATVLPYAINSATGALTPIGPGTQVASQPGQTVGSMVVDPMGRYLYVLDQLNYAPANHTVTALAIDQSTGAVSAIGSASTGSGPNNGDPGSVVCDPSGQFVYVVDMNSAGTFPAELAAFTISASASSAGQLIPIGLYNELPPTQFFVGGSAIALVE